MVSNNDPIRRTPRYQKLLAELRSGQNTILLDGPISTELDNRGIKLGHQKRVAKEDPETLIQVHMDYINAGARIISTNTFGRNRDVLGLEFEELTRAAVDCALEARRRTKTEESVIIAGCLAYHTIQGGGKYDPNLDPKVWERDMNDFVGLLKSAGVDVMLLEMVGGPTFTPPIIKAVQAYRMPFWVGFSAHTKIAGGGVRVFDNASTPIDEALPGLIQLAIEGPEGVFKGEADSGADVIGAMHCKPETLGAVLEAVQAHGWDGPMLAYPDDVRQWDPIARVLGTSNDPVDVFCTHCMNYKRDFPKCSLLGACCGYSVKHIAALDHCLRLPSAHKQKTSKKHMNPSYAFVGCLLALLFLSKPTL